MTQRLGEQRLRRAAGEGQLQGDMGRDWGGGQNIREVLRQADQLAAQVREQTDQQIQQSADRTAQIYTQTMQQLEAAFVGYVNAAVQRLQTQIQMMNSNTNT